jgi:hypothetical protein
MKPRGIANRAMELRESRRLDADGFLRRTFTLPIDDARAKAREILREYRTGGGGDPLATLDFAALPSLRVKPATLPKLDVPISYKSPRPGNSCHIVIADELQGWADGVAFIEHAIGAFLAGVCVCVCV